MTLPLFLLEQTLHRFHFFGWHDIVEIIFFSSLCYYFFLWLQADKQKNLFPYFFYYWSATIFAFLCSLKTMYLMLLILSPIILLVFMMLHQTTLQRNYITLMNITPPPDKHPSDWLEIAFRGFLYGMNRGKSIHCIIEQHNSIRALIETPINLNTPLQLDLLNMLIDTPTFDDTKYIIINHSGKLIGINSILQNTKDDTWLNDERETFPLWQQENMMLTLKSDAITLYANASTRNFTVIVQGKMIQHLDAKDTLKIIKKYVIKYTNTIAESKDLHGTTFKENTSQQFVP